MKYIFTFIILTIFFQVSSAQNIGAEVINYFKKNYQKEKLDKNDVENIKIIAETNLSDKLTKVYYVQQFKNNYPIKNAIATVAVKNNKIVTVTHSFISLKQQNFDIKNITELDAAIKKILLLKKFPKDLEFKIKEEIKNVYKIQLENYKNHSFYTDLYLSKINTSIYKPVWNFEIFDPNFENLYQIELDASNLEIISNTKMTLSCANISHNHSNSTSKNKSLKSSILEENITNRDTENASYLAYDFNLSGPLQGIRTLQNTPSDPIASPYGWHDTNGIYGPEYTQTRGNNVIAYEDRNSQNTIGYMPNGGQNLQFNFQYQNENQNPNEYIDASITNLFYINNKLHDFFYHFGFDENSGNFQENQYNRLNNLSFKTPDPLLAEAQDGSGFNNANISVPRDGSSPRMQMYLWKNSQDNIIKINSPIEISGYYEAVDNVFDPGNIPIPIYPNQITSKLILVNTPLNNGCTAIENGDELNGNIALIKRGGCDFTQKVINAQNAGAIAVIVMNNEDGETFLNMSGANSNIRIPVIFVLKSTGDIWLEELLNNTDINITIAKGNDTRIYDASFDNSIIIHEFLHGISIRLTGGRAISNCLTSSEQMGEGWSDYFAALLQIKLNDTGENPIGIGSFSSGNNRNELGIRRYPYSTSMAINPLTYQNIAEYTFTNNGQKNINSHAIGSVWASILWDLTWNLIDIYGFDSDYSNTESGNYKAVEIIINALKLQPCNPSFVTGRNALLSADLILNNGENSCTIWQSFARRGVGKNALAGLNDFADDLNDQIVDFNLPENCNLALIENTTNPILKAYPNPATNELFIEIPNYTSAISLEIYDLRGRKIIFDKIDNFSVKHRISIQNLASGVYLLNTKGQNLKTTIKFIKN